MRLLFFIPLLLSLTITYADAQDLSGIWNGKLIQEEGGCFPEYNIELQINFIVTANTLSGRSYDYHTTTQYVKLDFTGRYNPANRRMVIMENNLLESKIPATCIPCVKTYDLTWTKTGNEESLVGVCRGREYGSNNSICPAYKVVLKRAAQSAFSTDVEQSPELAALQQKISLEPRAKEIVHDLKLEAPEIKIDVYDNAEIDNDTVTIFLNNKLLVYRQMLKAQPLSIKLNAFSGTDYELMMYADNLGSIPPNTALMVVTAGTKKYELRVASNNQKSGVVKFRYDKKE
jgi:hypothetical protein